MKKLFALFALALSVISPVALAATAVISGVGILPAIVQLIVIALIFWAIWWFIGYVGVPEPFNKIVRVLMGLSALIIVINFLLSLIGSPLFVWGV